MSYIHSISETAPEVLLKCRALGRLPKPKYGNIDELVHRCFKTISSPRSHLFPMPNAPEGKSWTGGKGPSLSHVKSRIQTAYSGNFCHWCWLLSPRSWSDDKIQSLVNAFPSRYQWYVSCHHENTMQVIKKRNYIIKWVSYWQNSHKTYPKKRLSISSS